MISCRVLIGAVWPLLFLLASPFSVWAGETLSPESEMVWLSGIKMLASLLLVLALILLCYGAARRWLKWLPKNSQGRIQLQEMRALGPRKSLCLVQVDGRQLLLALQPERIELLLELSSAESGFATTLRQEQSRLRAEEGEDL